MATSARPKPKKKRDERSKFPPKPVTPKRAAKEHKDGPSDQGKAPGPRSNKHGRMAESDKMTKGKKEGREINKKARKTNKAKSFKNN